MSEEVKELAYVRCFTFGQPQNYDQNQINMNHRIQIVHINNFDN